MIATRLLGLDPATGPVDALRMLAGSGGPSPLEGSRPADAVLVHTPVARSNPFVDLLTHDLAGAGVVAVPAEDPAAAAGLAVRLADLSRGRVGCVVHLHWLHRVTATAPDERRAAAAVRETAQALARARDAGARLLWTVHNVGPHRSRHPVAETALRHQIADLADLVHVMNPRTADLLGEGTVLDPERTRVLPHPSYLGSYPDMVTPALGRQRLGLPADAVVFVVFGRIQSYKGLDVLADAFQALASDHPGRYKLLVVGAVDGVGPGPVRARPGPTDPQIGALLVHFADHPDVVCHPLAIPDNQIQVVLRAADIAVVPNRVPLNSGAELLALSFDLPVVTTDDVPPDAGWGIHAAPGDVGALTDALRRAAQGFTGPAAAAARAAARQRAREVAPEVVGPRFAALVRELLDRPARGPTSTTGPDPVPDGVPVAVPVDEQTR